MNRIVTTNLQGISPDTLPPPRRSGPVRVLFIHGNIAGFRNVAAQLKHYCADRDDIDAVHVDLQRSIWMKVLGKSGPRARGWDFHTYRYLRFWDLVVAKWLRGPLPLNRFDVVHVMTQCNALGVVRSRRGPLPKLAINVDATAMQDVIDFGRSRIACWPFISAERRMFAEADLLICRNKWARESLERDFDVPSHRIHIARNAIAVPEAKHQPVPDQRGRPLRLGFVGNSWRRKGGDLVLRAHQRSLHENVQLHICGLKVAVDTSAKNVVWHGYIPREKLLGELLPSLDMFVLASREEMLPWAALEAASVGLPLVGPRVGGLPELIVDGETGLLFERGDEAGLLRALERLAGDASLRRRLGDSVRRHVEEHFNPDRTYPELLDRLVALADTDVPQEAGVLKRSRK